MILSAADKARGGVYTPEPIVRFLTEWAIRSPEDVVLEPAAGDGVFLRAAASRLRELGRMSITGHLVGVEIDPGEAAACQRAEPEADVRSIDFLALRAHELPGVGAVVGNPPFVRYQTFDSGSRALGLARGLEQGVVISRMASSWAHFVVHACSFLRPDGRLALVLPAELLSAQYARPVWALLTRRFRAVSVITFDDPAFEGVEVDALLVLADQGDPPAEREMRLSNISGLATLTPEWRQATTLVRTRKSAHVFDDAAEETYAALQASGRCVSLGAIASVDIGVVTGANAFFVLSKAERVRLGIPDKFAIPIVNRGRDAKGLEVRPAEERELLQFDESALEIASVAEYIEAGVKLGLQSRHKTSQRKVWYQVPLPKHRPDAFLSYMIHQAPRMVVAEGRWSTNLLHGVALQAPETVRAIAVAVLSSASQLSAEIEGRAYGGGVLKLEPSEAEEMLIPRLDEHTTEWLRDAFPLVDRLVREGHIRHAARVVDGLLGFDHDELQRALMKLRSRRLGRAGSARRQSARASDQESG